MIVCTKERAAGISEPGGSTSCPPHEEAAKDAAMHVPLLRLAGERVVQPCVGHQDRAFPRKRRQVYLCAPLRQQLRGPRCARAVCATCAHPSVSLQCKHDTATCSPELLMQLGGINVARTINKHRSP